MITTEQRFILNYFKSHAWILELCGPQNDKLTKK